MRSVSVETGQIVNHYRYSPYGVDAVFGSRGDWVTFVGRPEIGELMVLGLRIYDPAIGRFLSPDPIFQPINQNAYTLGNLVLMFPEPSTALLLASGLVSLAARRRR